MMTRGAIGNLINRYTSVLKKCHLLNTFGSLALAGAMAFCFAVSPVQAAAPYDLHATVKGSPSVTITGGGKISDVPISGIDAFGVTVGDYFNGGSPTELNGDSSADLEIFNITGKPMSSLGNGVGAGIYANGALDAADTPKEYSLTIIGNTYVHDVAGATAIGVAVSYNTIMQLDGSVTISHLTGSIATAMGSYIGATATVSGNVVIDDVRGGAPEGIFVSARDPNTTFNPSLKINGTVSVSNLVGSGPTYSVDWQAGIGAGSCGELTIGGAASVSTSSAEKASLYGVLTEQYGLISFGDNLDVDGLESKKDANGIAAIQSTVTVAGDTTIKNLAAPSVNGVIVSSKYKDLVAPPILIDTLKSDKAMIDLKGNVTISGLSTNDVTDGYAYGFQVFDNRPPDVIEPYAVLKVRGDTVISDITSLANTYGASVSGGKLDVDGNINLNNLTSSKYLSGLSASSGGLANYHGDATLSNFTLNGTQVGVDEANIVESIGKSYTTFDKSLTISGVRLVESNFRGVQALSGSTVDVAGDVNITDITSDGQGVSDGLYASDDDSSITTGNLNIARFNMGGFTTGVALNSDRASITVNGNADIRDLHSSTSNDSVYGIDLMGGGAQGYISVRQNLSIDNLSSAYVSGINSHEGLLTVGGDTGIHNLTATDGTASGLVLNSTNALAELGGKLSIDGIRGGDVLGVNITDGQLTVGGDTDIHDLTSTDGTANGLYFNGRTAHAEFGGKLSISRLFAAEGGKATGILVNGDGLNQDIPNGLNIDMSDGTNTVSLGDAINVGGFGNTFTFGSPKAPVAIIGDLRVADQIPIPNVAVLGPNLLEGKFMTPDSYLKGFTYADPSKLRAAGEPFPGVINLTFANNAFWELSMKNRSDAATLTAPVVNTLPGTLSLDNSDVYVGSRKAEFSTTARMDQNLGANDTVRLAVNSLEGNGNFHLRADVEKDLADSVYAKTATGNYRLFVASSGKNTVESMNSYLARQDAGNASFTLGNTDGKVDAGFYVYDLGMRNPGDAAAPSATEWFLRRTPDKSPTAQTEAALSGLAGNYAIWSAQQSNLRKRLGEVRYGSQTGLWARGFFEKDTLDGLSGSNFQQNIYGGSIGYDFMTGEGEESAWIFGTELRAARADQDVNGTYGGSGDLDSLGGGLYATWIHADGWYVDASASYDHYNQDIKSTMLDGNRVKDSHSTYGLGTSVEFGRKLMLGTLDANGSFWFAEPQVQLSYFWLKGKNSVASNGMRIDRRDSDSLTARAGIVLGKKFSLGITEDDPRYVQPYVKAGIIQEFAGSQSANLNDIRQDTGLTGTRGYFGAGVDWQANDSLRVYMEAEREQGKHFTREFNVSAGLKWEF